MMITKLKLITRRQQIGVYLNYSEILYITEQKVTKKENIPFKRQVTLSDFVKELC